jgi:ligand-binding sensor domain-containing protein
LPSSEVYHVMQDSKGYMWFCTDAGVSRYDGYTFHNYSNRNGLGDNTIFASYEDHKGRIWFRSLSGRLFYYLGDSIYGIGANDKILADIHHGIMGSLYIDSGDTIWCGVSLGNHNYKIAPPYGSGNISLFQIQQSCTEFFDVDGKGFIWSTKSSAKNNQNDSVYSGTLIFRNKAGIVRRGNKPGLVNNSFFYRIHSGELFMTADSYQMIDKVVKVPAEVYKIKSLYYIVTQKMSILKDDSSGIFTSQGLPFVTLYEDRNLNLWAGRSKGGVYVFPDCNLNIKKPVHYLDGLTVTCINEDSEGGFWFSTLENGVYYMTSAGLLFYDKSSGLPDNKVNTLLFRDSSSIWAGMASGDLAILNSDTVIRYPVEKNRKSNLIYRLSRVQGKSELVVGSSWSYTLQTGKPEAHFIKKGIEFDTYKSFTCDKNGMIWAGNHMFLVKIDPEENKVVESYVSKSRILSVYSDANNRIWLGCVNGLWSLNKGEFSFEGDKNVLFKNRIEDIQVSSDGVWWFATKGAGVIARKGKEIITITEHNGLSSNICRGIYIDWEGNIWVSTNNGISKIAMRKWGEYSIDVYSSDDGLPSNEINQIVRTGNRIWAASNQGIVAFDVTKIFVNLSPPPIYLSAVEINSVSRPVTDTFHLRYYENYLQIYFTGLSYKRNSKLKYQYQLQGLDTGWRYTQTKSIQYTTLPPGTYRFVVYAINNDGMRSKVAASVCFVIAKPFWKEWWFVISLIGFFLSVAIWLGNYRVQLLKKQVLEKAEVNRKIADLKLMALRAQMNPHFIFNSINSIQLFILKNDTDSAHKHLSRFSKLIRHVLENSKHEYITIVEEIRTLELYIELERLRFSSKFDFKIIVNDEINIENVLISPLLIQPYVENAIWHGLMHLKQRPGELTITLEKSNSLLKISIEDNGIGRKNSMAFKRDRTHKSVGLSINKERVEIMNSLHHNSALTVQFIDKKDDQGEPLGTRVEIFLPFLLNLTNYDA